MVSMSAIREASGLRVGRTLDERNSQNPSKYQANITKLSDKRGSKEVQAPYYAVLRSCSQLEFQDRLLKRSSSIGNKSVNFEQ